jgi:hypothetical protein
LTIVTKFIEALILDLNSENSEIAALFENITKALFRGIILLGVPLIGYLIIQLYQGL